MNNNAGWPSEYRRKKFEKRYKNNSLPKPLPSMPEPPIVKTIAVMLDVEGTSLDIDDETALAFIKSLDVIRKKFGAKYGTISLSTHCYDSEKMKQVLKILSRNLSKNIRIGINFFRGGIYDFKSDREERKQPSFNGKKVDTFMNYYVNDTLGIENVWFALIDDNIEDDVYNRCPQSHPVLIAKPSSREKDLTKNSFVRIATVTKGFEGVLEIMSTYLENIRHMTPDEIKETQQNMIMHLSSYDLVQKIGNREYAFIKRYFVEGYADEDDYNDALGWLVMILPRRQNITKEELVLLSEIFQLIKVHLQEKATTAQENDMIAFQNILKEKKKD